MTNKPATPLPWRSLEWKCAPIGNNSLDDKFIRHAANAYPRLVAALREIVHPDMDLFRNLTGSNAAAINALLRELGEAPEAQ